MFPGIMEVWVGFLRRIRNTLDTRHFWKAWDAARDRGFPLQLKVLSALMGRPLEWEENGQLIRGVATGNHRGARAGFDTGKAEFLVGPPDELLWRFPMQLLRGRFTDTGELIEDVAGPILFGHDAWELALAKRDGAGLDRLERPDISGDEVGLTPDVGPERVRELFHSTQVVLLRRTDLSGEDLRSDIEAVDVNDSVTGGAHLAMSQWARFAVAAFGIDATRWGSDVVDLCERQVLFACFYGYLGGRRATNADLSDLPFASALVAHGDPALLDQAEWCSVRIATLLGHSDWDHLMDTSIGGLVEVLEHVRSELLTLDEDTGLGNRLAAAGWDGFSYGIAVALLETAPRWPEIPDYFARQDSAPGAPSPARAPAAGVPLAGANGGLAERLRSYRLGPEVVYGLEDAPDAVAEQRRVLNAGGSPEDRQLTVPAQHVLEKYMLFFDASAQALADGVPKGFALGYWLARDLLGSGSSRYPYETSPDSLHRLALKLALVDKVHNFQSFQFMTDLGLATSVLSIGELLAGADEEPPEGSELENDAFSCVISWSAGFAAGVVEREMVGPPVGTPVGPIVVDPRTAAVARLLGQEEVMKTLGGDVVWPDDDLVNDALAGLHGEDDEPSADDERRSNILRVMADATVAQIPPVEEAIVIAAHLALLYTRGLMEPPESWPVEPQDFPSVVHELLGDALLHNLEPEAIPSEPGSTELAAWHEEVARALRHLGSHPIEFDWWQDQVTTSAERHLDELLTPDVEEGARKIFVMLLLSLLLTAGLDDASTVTDLADQAFDAARSRLDEHRGDESDERTDAHHLGSSVVDELLEQLQWHADEEWFTPRPDGFNWLAHRLTLSVTSSEPQEFEGGTGCRVAIRTEVVHDVAASDDAVASLLNELNADAGCEAFIFEPMTRMVYAATDAWIDRQTHRLVGKMLYELVTTQVAAAESRCDLLAEAVGGRPAVTVHPRLGVRPGPDILLEAGFSPSTEAFPLGPEEFAAIARAQPFAAWDTTISGTGLTTEVPVGSAQRASVEPRSLGTALLTLTVEREVAPRRSETSARYRLGDGLLLRLLLPLDLLGVSGAALANELNLAEATALVGVHRLGAWYVEEGTLAFCGFLPGGVLSIKRNPRTATALATDLALGAVARAEWVMGSDHLRQHRPRT